MLNCKLTTPSDSDYKVLLSWFKTTQELISWAGHSIGESMKPDQILKHLNKSEYRSHTLKFNASNDDSSTATALVGFGQYQHVAEILHLARLTINPHHRKRGLLKVLIYKLVEQAEMNAKVRLISLFVFRKNRDAYLAYKKFGFIKISPPIGFILPEGCDYMVLENRKLKQTISQI